MRRSSRYPAPRRRRADADAGAGVRWRAVGLVWCVVALLGAAVISLLWQGTGASPAQAASQPTTYLTLSVNHTEDLATGEAMDLTVSRTPSGTAAGVEIRRVVSGWCAPGTTLPTAVPAGPNQSSANVLPTVRGGTTVCTTPTFPVINTSVKPPLAIISAPKNATTNYPSAAGTTFAQESSGTQLRNGVLACNTSHPCTFGVAVYVTFKNPAAITATLRSGAIYYLQVPVTFLPSTAAASCGGVAPGRLSSAGPDRVGHLVTDWIIDACQARVGGGKALANVPTTGGSDSSALCAFAGGAVDFAYSAVGYGTSGSAFNPANCTGGAKPDRPYVAVPIALDAVTLSHTQTIWASNNAASMFSVTDYSARPRMTDAQLAQLLGAGGLGSWTGSPLGQALVRQTPTFANDLFYTGIQTTFGFNPIVRLARNGNRGVVVTSGTTVTAFLVTRFLQAVAATTLRSPTAGHPKVGTIANFGLATPKLDTLPATGLSAITHVLTPGTGPTGMPWALLSALDADSLWFGMANVSLQAPGTTVYVSPTTSAALQAAVATMAAQPDGTLLPSLTGGKVGGSDPYPLTYVEYVIAPTQPLMGPNCTLRTQSQTNLTDWLSYITGVGQTELPAGLAPLPPALQAQAISAIAQVGESPPGCIPPTGTTTSTTTTATTPSTTGAGTGSSSGPSSSSSGAKGSDSGASSSGSSSATSAAGRSSFSSTGFAGRGTGTTSTSNNPGGPTPTATSAPPVPATSSHADPVAAALADFTSPPGSGWALPFVAVLVLFLLLPGMVLLVSGRSPRQAVAAVRAFLIGDRPPPPGSPPSSGGAS